MTGQICVLLNPRTSMVADVTDDAVFGLDPRNFRVVDLVRVFRYPVAGEHEWGWSFCFCLRREGFDVRRSCEDRDGESGRGKGFLHIHDAGRSRVRNLQGKGRRCRIR